MVLVLISEDIEVIAVDYGGFLYLVCPGGDGVVPWVKSIVQPKVLV